MELVSVRMRASFKGSHVSGSERICKKEEVSSVVSELLKRPKVYDFISLKTEHVEHVELIKMPPIRSFDFKDIDEARDFAKKLLAQSGIKREILEDVFYSLSAGAGVVKI